MARSPRITTIFRTIILLATTQNAVFAGGPELAFDFSRVAECVDVSSEAHETLYAGEKLVELKLRVSVHLLSGKIGDVEEVRIELGDVDNRLRVHSFSPGTELTSNYSDDIEWTRTTEDSKELGASLGGELPTPIGGLIANVTPSISGATSNREKITEKQLRVAPKFAVVASGTIAQGHGVFFKLRSSPQTSLEGTHEFAVRFVVPAKWRGDAIRVCCQATGTEKVFWITQQKTWAHSCGGVAMYLAGDAKARQAAIRFVDSRG